MTMGTSFIFSLFIYLNMTLPKENKYQDLVSWELWNKWIITVERTGCPSVFLLLQNGINFQSSMAVTASVASNLKQEQEQQLQKLKQRQTSTKANLTQIWNSNDTSSRNWEGPWWRSLDLANSRLVISFRLEHEQMLLCLFSREYGPRYTNSLAGNGTFLKNKANSAVPSINFPVPKKTILISKVLKHHMLQPNWTTFPRCIRRSFLWAFTDSTLFTRNSPTSSLHLYISSIKPPPDPPLHRLWAYGTFLPPSQGSLPSSAMWILCWHFLFPVRLKASRGKTGICLVLYSTQQSA